MNEEHSERYVLTAKSAGLNEHLDLVVITTRNEQGLGLVEVDPTHGSVVLIEAVYQGPHTVVP